MEENEGMGVSLLTVHSHCSLCVSSSNRVSSLKMARRSLQNVHVLRVHHTHTQHTHTGTDTHKVTMSPSSRS